MPEPPENNRAQLFPVNTTMKALSIIPGPMISITGSYQERRSFAFFCYQTGQQLSTALEVTKTYQLILQVSHCDGAVRAAVIALGAIGERLSINNLLTLDNEQANACHSFAHWQYYKALRCLRERISNNPEGSANFAVILSFLFTVFEFLQGDDTASLIHLRGGLNILRRGQGSLSMGLQTIASEQDPLTHEILRIFSTMDLQATIWLGLNGFQAPIMIPIHDHESGLAHLDQFSTLDEASGSLNYQVVTTYHFQRLVATYDSGESVGQVPQGVYGEREKLILQLKKWLVSFEALIRKPCGDFSTEMSERIIVLKINYETGLMMLTVCLQASDQQFYADHELGFRKIVTLARALVRPRKDIERIVAANNSKSPASVFSFYIGVIRPLYFTAIKCQNMDVCRQAINLLSASPWREGAWDSATMARIAARRVQKVEERYVRTNILTMDRLAEMYVQGEHIPANFESPSVLAL